jgi:phosphatidylglycerol lysyltransferase
VPRFNCAGKKIIHLIFILLGGILTSCKKVIMSSKAKRTFRRLLGYSGFVFFGLAVGMLWWQLRNYSLSDIARALLNIPVWNLAAAAISCFAGYVALAFYDYLALGYIGADGKVSWWKWMLAGMLGFAISNNAGHAVVSGGAIRYRLYTRWRIRGGDIVKILTINGFTYFLGATAIVVFGYFLIPHEVFTESIGVSVGLNTLFIFCLATLLAYFGVTVFFRHKSVKIGQLKFAVPTTKMAVFQTLLGITDSVLAGLVLYFCLTPFVQIPFGTYIGLFVVAQTTGVFSQVPGGIGVFESIFLLALPDGADKASVFGALLAYRIIYYVLPLVGVGVWFFIYERWLRARMRRWINEAKQKIPYFANKNTEK